MFSKSFRYLFTAMIAVIAFSSAAQAEFPDKPVTLVIVASAGGSHDLTARVLTSVIPTYLGAPMIVKLSPGAAGQLATAEVARAAPDGYTILYSLDSIDQVPQLIADVPYDSNRDLIALAQLSTQPFNVVVRGDSPFKTLEDMMTHARANPGKLKFAHSGEWGPAMLFGGSLLGLSGIEVNYIAYAGGGPSMQALLAGDGDFTAQAPSTIAAQGDKVRVLVTPGSKRMYDDVPTTEELGLTEAYGVFRRAVFAPRGTPPDRVAKLRQAFIDVQKDKTYVRLMSRIGENTNFVDGETYENELRPTQAAFFKGLVNKLTGGKAR